MSPGAAVACVFCFLGLLMAGIISLGLHLSRVGCASTAQGMSLNHRYGVTMGCLIEPKPGVWVPLASFKYIED